MGKLSNQGIAEHIVNQAKLLGADLAGIAHVSDVKSSPSFTLGPKMPDAGNGVGIMECKPGLKPGEVSWPENAKSILVLGVAHPKEKPELDWWYGQKSPSGNRMLMSTAKQLCGWISQEFSINTVHLPYHIEKGGIYLKDAAIMAGLGCVGKNNLFLTPEYGPRIRLRALTLDAQLLSTGPADFDPCVDCKVYCRRACPQGAFNQKMFNSGDHGLDHLPGREGSFARPTCNIQMEKDIEVAKTEVIDGFDEPVKIVKYCRRCELACPVGKPTNSGN